MIGAVQLSCAEIRVRRPAVVDRSDAPAPRSRLGERRPPARCGERMPRPSVCSTSGSSCTGGRRLLRRDQGARTPDRVHARGRGHPHLRGRSAAAAPAATSAAYRRKPDRRSSEKHRPGWAPLVEVVSEAPKARPEGLRSMDCHTVHMCRAPRLPPIDDYLGISYHPRIFSSNERNRRRAKATPLEPCWPIVLVFVAIGGVA